MSVQLDVLDLVQPAIEGGDIGSDRIHVHPLGGEDDGVLALIDRNLNGPVNDDVQASLVHGLTIALVFRPRNTMAQCMSQFCTV